MRAASRRRRIFRRNTSGEIDTIGPRSGHLLTYSLENATLRLPASLRATPRERNESLARAGVWCFHADVFAHDDVPIDSIATDPRNQASAVIRHVDDGSHPQTGTSEAYPDEIPARSLSDSAPATNPRAIIHSRPARARLISRPARHT